MKITTPEQRAKTLFQGDWDEDGTTAVSLPRALAVNLLENRGWTTGRKGEWISPGGYVYWEISEAVAIALVAEIV